MPRKKQIRKSCNGKPATTESMKKLPPDIKNETKIRAPYKRKSDIDSNDNSKKITRSCSKFGCNVDAPVCFAEVAQKCVGDGYTSRWYHITKGEHFCNECFEYFYRNYKDGYEMFCDWKTRWSSNGKTEPSIKSFMSDLVLPYWIQCTRSSCGKWRLLPKDIELTSQLSRKYECSMNAEGYKKSSNFCAVAEDPRVVDVKSETWKDALISPPYFKNSPAAQFLGAYFPEGVGISPTCEQCMKASAAYQEARKKILAQSNGDCCTVNENILSTYQQIPGLNENIHPFYQPDEHGKASSVRPDVMEEDEIQEFAEYAREPAKYVGIRNLIIALWSLNFKEWLTVPAIAAQIICRGLIRIHCVLLAEKILKFLTRKGIVNLGFVEPPADFCLIPKNDQSETIVIIGAGVAGLMAARQLHNFGFKVMILEGRDRIGGRVSDDNSMGTCIGKGAQIITGVVNNPLTLLCDQADIKPRIIREKCDLFDFQGDIVGYDEDKKIDKHFNEVLDASAKWRKEQESDVPLYDKLMELSRQRREVNGEKFSNVELALLDFHIGNLEYACGSVLNNVSALNWDQNEAFPQYAGDHSLLPCGYNVILTKIAKNLDIRLNTRVRLVDYSNDEINICTDSEIFSASKVIVTVPLALLQRDNLDFKPPLPHRKIKSIRSLGSGVIEKVVLQFPHRFWAKKLSEADFFGYIPVSSSERGLFAIFYDMTPHCQKTGPHILMTYASGDAVNFVEQNPHKEIINYCMKVLRKIFSDKDIIVPDPIKYLVTNWRNDPFSHMAYSYVKVDGSGDAYDGLAEDINEKVFFAGEATNRQFPQTVTGAFLSGLREANKITRCVLKSSG